MVVLMRAFTGISIHAPRAGSDENALKNWSTLSSFQSTLPVRGATSKEDKQKMETTISIHAPRAGSDLTGMSDPEKWIRFQSTLPVRGATSFSRAAFAGSCYFNPRSPCGERRYRAKVTVGKDIFQSTLPVRGATRRCTKKQCIASKFQSTLPVRGATMDRRGAACISGISIHAPRAGSDVLRINPLYYILAISIHAPRAGSDFYGRRRGCDPLNFNPRSPCGERLGGDSVVQREGDFNPRSPCGERQYTTRSFGECPSISIHAPRAGSDADRWRPPRCDVRFQSTLPVRGATARPPQ